MLQKPGTHSSGPHSLLQLRTGPHGFDWMCGKRGTSVSCSWRRSSEQQLASPWLMPSWSSGCCQLHYVQRTRPQVRRVWRTSQVKVQT